MDEEKIGFNSKNTTNPLEKTGKTKFSSQKTAYDRFVIAIFIIAVIFTFAATGYFVLPFASVVFAILYAIIVVILIIGSVVLTLFIILNSEGYRQWVGRAWGRVEWFFSATEHIAEISQYFVYLCWPALGLDALAILLCIIGLTKFKKRHTTYLVFSIIAFIIVLVFTITFYASGQKLISK